MENGAQHSAGEIHLKRGLDPAFCQFPLPDVINSADLLDSRPQEKQALSIWSQTTCRASLCDALHECLKKSVYRLPWFLDRMRLDSSLTSEDIITKVFRDVKKNSGTPVTAVIDIHPPTSNNIHNQVPSLSSPGVFERAVQDPKSLVLSSFDARSFTRQVKQLVDKGVMQCLFAATERLSFQVEAVRESRLDLFMASELSIIISERYLQQLGLVTNEKEKRELLSHLPRSFTNLKDFAQKEDRKVFVDSQFEKEMAKIRVTLSDPKDLKVKDIYRLALKRDLNILDFYEFKYSQDEVMKVFVEPNIFTVTLEQLYQFQFDATAAAAKQVVTCSEETHRWF